MSFDRFIAFCFILFLAVPVYAKDRPWMKYENDYFVVFSNAKEKTTRKILGEFELFRAVSYQISQNPPPDDAPKALMLLTATQDEFEALRPYESAGAFTTYDGQRSLIVMTLGGSRKYARKALRHEYGHVLMQLGGTDYPSWYAEGFAEIMAGIVVHRRKKTFKLGTTTERLDIDGPLNSWNPIISSDFDPHRLGSHELIAAAYTQSFVLSHYYLLSGIDGVREDFQRYFVKVALGDSESEAFSEVFGHDPDSFWREVLQPYAKKLPTLTLPLPIDKVDTKLDVSLDTEGTARRLMTLLRGKFRIGQPASSVVPIETISGSWSTSSFDSQCQTTHEISVDEKQRQITIESELGADMPRIDVFDWLTADDYYELWQLLPGTTISNTLATPFRIFLPEPGLICFSRPDTDYAPCQPHLVRCRL